MSIWISYFFAVGRIFSADLNIVKDVFVFREDKNNGPLLMDSKTRQVNYKSGKGQILHSLVAKMPMENLKIILPTKQTLLCV